MTNCSRLWPPDDPVLASVHWSMIAGALLRLHDNIPAGYVLERPLLIAIRGAAPGDSQTHEIRHEPGYRDAFVLVQKTTMPMLFRASSTAYQLDSREAPDESGDGRGDVGSIRPGRFVLTDTGSQPSPIFTVALPNGSTKLPAWRDTNHDRQLDAAEREKAEAARKGRQVNDGGYYATSVLLHEGFPKRSSIACLTAEERYLEVIRDAAHPTGGKLDCILIDAPELVAIVNALPPLDDEPTRRINPGSVV